MAGVPINSQAISASSEAVIVYGLLASEEVTAGKIVFVNGSNQWELANAGPVSPGGVAIISQTGFALNHAYAGQPLAVCLEDPDLLLENPSAPVPILTQGDQYYLSPDDSGGGGYLDDISALDATTYRVLMGTAIDGYRIKFLKTATNATAT